MPKPPLSQRIDELNQEIEWFYGDDFSLDQAVEKYKSTLAQAKSLQQDLQTLQNEITKIEEDFTKE